MTRQYTYTLRRAQEERERKRRDAEFERASVTQYFNEHKALHQACLAEERAEANVYSLKAALRHHEKSLLDQIDEAERQHLAGSAAALAADRQASEQEAEALQREGEGKQRQHILQESAELNDLQQLIHAAAVRVKRDEQLKSKADLELAQRVANQELFEYQELQRRLACKMDRMTQAERREQGRAANEGLALQLQYNKLLDEDVQEQTVVERARLDAAAAAEDAQDAKEARLRGLKQEQERLFIHDYLAGQEHTKFNQALDHAAEDARIEAFEEQQRLREDALAAAQAAKKQRAEMRYESIKGRREAELRAKEDEQRLIDLLRADDLTEASRQEAARRRQQSEDLRRQMAEANQLQIQLKMERNAAVKEEEESFRRQLLASFAEQDRVEQMNDHKRRMCIEQHKREANRLVAEKQALQAAAEAKEGEARAAEEARQQQREAVIAAEKERLLAEAGPLRQYLPRRVLDNKKRLPPLMPAYLD